MEEFLADENFGRIYGLTENSIQYTDLERGAWTLIFNNGLLHTITHRAFIG